MPRLTLPTKVLSLAAGIAISTGLVACHAAAPLPPGNTVGYEMDVRTPVTFATVDADPTTYFDRIVLVEASVTAVCKSKGCWMQIEDEGRTAMVRWETGCGGEFAFPEDAIGERVLIQGSFYPKTIAPEDAEHLREEAGGELELELDGYEFNASAVRVLDVASAAR